MATRCCSSQKTHSSHSVVVFPAYINSNSVYIGQYSIANRYKFDALFGYATGN